jgi:hypothetical protein
MTRVGASAVSSCSTPAIVVPVEKSGEKLCFSPRTAGMLWRMGWMKRDTKAEPRRCGAADWKLDGRSEG